jgi:hypothetical protein
MWLRLLSHNCLKFCVQTALGRAKKLHLSRKTVFLFGLVTMKKIREFDPHPHYVGRSDKPHAS